MKKINFKVNELECSVEDGDVLSDLVLLDYLRMQLGLRGTKYMCREGACGACVVSAVTSPGDTPKSVNSCLVSVAQCHEWEITTIEKVGNKLDGYHSIQKKLAEKHGTQCGYCSPGWVMAMYSLAQNNKELTQLEIENSFGSNICRCTGYRPIMDAFKSFAKDAPNSQIADIEDLYVCKKTNKRCNKSCKDDDWCIISDLSLQEEQPIDLKFKDGKMWYKVKEVKQIFEILSKESGKNYMLVCGNTAKGAFPVDENPDVFIDINGVSELTGYEIDQNLIVGANNTLTDLLSIFEDVSKENNFNYLQKFHDHIKLVAHIPVRNMGSVAGNLMIKHMHNNFPSDIFLLLETVGAYLTILDSDGSKQTMTLQEFLKLDMNNKIIYNILLPPLNDEYELVTLKVMPRAQNAHAIVNGGFLYRLQKADNTVLEARIVLGGLSPSFIRATKTEEHLKGKHLFLNETLQSALKTLDGEIIVVDDLPATSPAYRRQLALSLFYKGLLTLCPSDVLGPRYQSGQKRLYESRPVSQGKQTFGTDPKLYPLNQPIQKVEGLIQCAGEAPYTDDVPALPREVFAAFVLSTVALGNIQDIDASEALKIPGVIAFYSAKDIPGKNSFVIVEELIVRKDEEIFCSDKVSYYNQPLGMIVAESTAIAERAAKRVKVSYANVATPVLDINKTKDDKTRTKLFIPIPAIGRGLFVHKKFTSNYTVRAQLHFCMENISCVAVPSEHGLEVHATSQWMDIVQNAVAAALDLNVNRVDVYTRRLGGGFGFKGTRANLASVACSLAAFKLNRPCRLIQSASSLIRALGKRLPCSCDVEVEVDKKGEIQHMDYKSYEDNGYIVSELINLLGVDAHHNCYKRLWWNYFLYDSTTDSAHNTACRAPASLEHIAFAETIMEQISYELSLDPYDVRMENLNVLLHGPLKEMAEKMKSDAEYDKRKAEVERFNIENRWIKRGLKWAFMKFLGLFPSRYEINMSINHGDGSVTINHGGIEMGQGINTKAIQICAHFLEIPVESIVVKPHNTITAPNSTTSAGSITSQSIGMGVEACCKELLKRLKPIRILLLNPTWEQLIKKAHALKVDLQARHLVNDIVSPAFPVYGVTLSEVEVDILTGECQVTRVDLMEDVGQSVSPQIDVGQVEGGFIMGLSYWMFEKVVYDNNTGEIKSDRPWDYYVAQCKDIPQDFRISFKENSYSDSVVLGSKVTGETAICMAISVPFAMRHAVVSAREDAGIPSTEWFSVDGAFTTEQVCLLSGTKIEDYKFH